jgi:hypothetical protein
MALQHNSHVDKDQGSFRFYWHIHKGFFCYDHSVTVCSDNVQVVQEELDSKLDELDNLGGNSVNKEDY